MGWGIAVGLAIFFTGVVIMLFGIAILSYSQSSNSEWMTFPNSHWISIPLPEWLSIPIPQWMLITHTPNTDAPWIYLGSGIGGLILGIVIMLISNKIQR